MTSPAIDEDHLRAALRDLLQIPSVGGTSAEADIQWHIAAAWQAEGLTVDAWPIDLDRVTAQPGFPGMEVDRRQAVGVTATLAGIGGGQTLLINCHTDVVPPGDLRAWTGDPFIVREVDHSQAFIARGACDMKAGVVAAWAAVRTIREAGIRLRGDVILAPVSGEEDGGLGTYALLDRLAELGVRPDRCVIPEPTGLDIVPANAGALTFRLVVPGKATHASRRTEGVSAIECFMPILRALQDLEARRNRDVDPLMRRWPLAYPLSIGTIQAGDWASTVPDRLTAEGRLGVALDEPVAQARADLEAAVADACRADPWLRDHPVQVQWWGGQFAPGRTDSADPLLEDVAAAHARITGRPPAVYGAPYGSDLRLIRGLGGIPTIQYGPGDAATAHTADEFVRIDEVRTCAEVLVQVILRTCQEA
ncbi:MAG: ArgE/DapE family deacylase [Actinomycetales bacterium]|nr:ArgE/DapE family deacylase [Actinomycetales bacterium]